jgi:hypothetical protein
MKHSVTYGTRRFITMLQESAIVPYTEPDEFSPHIYTSYFKIRFNIISSSIPRCFMWRFSFSFLWQTVHVLPAMSCTLHLLIVRFKVFTAVRMYYGCRRRVDSSPALMIQYVSPKIWHAPTSLHGATTQKNVIISFPLFLIMFDEVNKLSWI